MQIKLLCNSTVNSNIFENGYKKISNMPENAAIVIDNALYIDKIPHSNSCKSKIVDWLAAKTIIDSLNTLKVELIELIKLKLSCLKLIN